jgi:hypothetical protein
VQWSVRPLALAVEGVVPAIVAPIADSVQNIDLAVIVPINRIEQIVASDVVVARKLDLNPLGKTVAAQIVVVASPCDQIRSAVSVEIGNDGVALPGAEPESLVEKRLLVRPDVAKQVGTVVEPHRARHDQIRRAILIEVNACRMGLQAHGYSAAHARTSIGDALAGPDHRRLHQTLRLASVAVVKVDVVAARFLRSPADECLGNPPVNLGRNHPSRAALDHAQRVGVESSRQLQLNQYGSALRRAGLHRDPVAIGRRPALGGSIVSPLDRIFSPARRHRQGQKK